MKEPSEVLVNQKHLYTIYLGKASPMSKVENLLVKIAIQKATVNQTITAAEGLISKLINLRY